MATTSGDWETVIGLEVHAQLLTRTKAFCGCATSFGDPPNTHTCPVCLGLPGALPVLGEEAVRMAASAALALGCTVRLRSVFSRKNYFYPDLPKGYQISQYDEPLAVNGALAIEADRGPRRARILRVHMEEDAGKNVHGQGDESIVDLNRAGTPLVEIVGEPDLRSGAEAAEYLKRLREILMFVGVNDGNLEQGSFRCDANVSVRKMGETALGTRTELKNINSFRFVADAIDVEARRQVAILEGGGRVRMETRGYNADKRETYLLRDKENEAGYRYFPEPDLPPLVLAQELVDDLRHALPPSPAERRRRMTEELGVTAQAAGVITSHPQIAAFYDTTLLLYTGPFAAGSAAGPDAVKAANFILSEVLRDVRPTGLTAEFPVTPSQIAELLRLVDRGTISGKQAKEVYARMRGTTNAPSSIVRDRGMTVLSDEGSLEALARKLCDENPKQVEGYRAGQTKLLGYFVGQVMKQTGGSADPAAVNRVLKRVLSGEAAHDGGSAPNARAERAQRETESGPTLSVHAVSTAGIPTPRVPRELDAAASRPAASGPTTPRSGARDRDDQSPLAESVMPPPPPLPLEHTTLTSASASAVVLPPTMESVGYEAFAQLDLRVGRVVSAARVPHKDKLLDLSVDVGDSAPRRILAGIGVAFAPEDVEGRRVIVICNLAPRDFGKGLVSEGMILAAGAGEGLALATVTSDLPPGTRVK